MGLNKERTLLIVSSALVLSALTMTGIYLRGQTNREKEDGYHVDLAQLDPQQKDAVLESLVDPNLENINKALQEMELQYAKALETKEELDATSKEELSLSAGSGLVQNPGLEKHTEEMAKTEQKVDAVSVTEEQAQLTEENILPIDTPAVIQKQYAFQPQDRLSMPVEGEVLLPFSMDKSIYFETLDQYKYNPAMMISAVEGTPVLACADGKVLDVFENEEIGHGLRLDLGNGYIATYGQLENLEVTIGSEVTRGKVLGNIKSPTKYYSVEGANLYFQVTKDGTPIDPSGLF